MPLSRKTILFIVPRFHTNMVGMVQAFLHQNWKVKICVQNVTKNEDHSLVVPDLLSEIEESKYIDEIKPSLVFFRRKRENESNLKLAMLCASKREIKFFNYDQHPVRIGLLDFNSLYSDLRKIVFNLSHGLPLKFYTPINKNLNKTITVPLPWRVKFDMPIAIPDKAFQRNYFEAENINIVVIGKLGQKRKRIEWIVQAINDIQLDGFQVFILGAGKGSSSYRGFDKNYYDSIISDLEKQSKISVLEDVPHQEVIEKLIKTDLFVLTSRNEQFGISPIEAATCGCAVLVPSDNGSAEYISNTAYSVYDWSSYKDFKFKLERLLSDKLLIKKIGKENLIQMKSSNSLVKFFEILQ